MKRKFIFFWIGGVYIKIEEHLGKILGAFRKHFGTF